MGLAFGLRRRGEKGAAVERKVKDMLERVGLRAVREVPSGALGHDDAVADDVRRP